MGRPHKSSAEKRSERLGIRLTPAERAELEFNASSLGLTVAEFTRRRALSYHVPAARTDDVRMAKLAAALIRLGNNLNQIARHMNAGRHAPPYLPELIARIDKELDRLYGARNHEGGPLL